MGSGQGLGLRKGFWDNTSDGAPAVVRGRVRMVGPSPVVALAPTPNPNPEPRTRTLHRQRDGAVGEQDHVLHHHGVRSLHIVDSAGVRPTQTWLFAPNLCRARGRASARESLPLLTILLLPN